MPPPRAGAAAGYALGVVSHRWNTWPDLLEHGGGGYGFLSRPVVGARGRDRHRRPHELPRTISSRTSSPRRSSPTSFASRVCIAIGCWRFRGGRGSRIPTCRSRPRPGSRASSPTPPCPRGVTKRRAGPATPGSTERSRGTCSNSTVRRPGSSSTRASRTSRAKTGTRSFARHRLAEIEPGLFLADDGETLDLRGPVPTWRNFRLVRVSDGPSPWQWAILGAAALVALTWLGGALARTVRRSPASRTATSRWRGVAATVAGATALVVLAAVALLAWLPGLVDAGFLGWLELPPAERLALHLPLAVAVLGASTAALVAAGWIGRWWPSAVRLQYTALAVAAVALGALLAGWHLIGWGMT